tara:strand:+ start:44 stop:358 length:315 start_codon:yes stop_codon:yes gene_type:complete
MTQNNQGTLTLVTPPSSITSNNESFCVVNFTEEDKTKFADYLNKEKPKDNLTIYIVDTDNKEMSLNWLTEVIGKSHNVIIKSKNSKFKILKSKTINKLEEVFNG